MLWLQGTKKPATKDYRFRVWQGLDTHRVEGLGIPGLQIEEVWSEWVV